jgi:hypothetical protein
MRLYRVCTRRVPAGIPIPLDDALKAFDAEYGDWQGSARVGVGERRLGHEKAHARHGERQAQHGDRSRYGEHGDGVLYRRHGTKLHQDPRLAGATSTTITEAGYRTITRATQPAKLPERQRRRTEASLQMQSPGRPGRGAGASQQPREVGCFDRRAKIRRVRGSR